MRRLRDLALLAASTMLLVVGAATAAAPKPDAHDRALAVQLAAKVATFRAIAAQTGGSLSTKSLDRCPYLKQHPKDAFAAVFALIPAFFIVVVNEYRPQLTDLEQTIAGMRPDAPLFRRWLGAEGKTFDLILEFDNHGRKVDLCQAATVMLTKSSTAADVQRVLGIDPALIAKIFSKSTSAVGETVTKLNPQMRTFLIAAGVSHRNAVALTSSST